MLRTSLLLLATGLLLAACAEEDTANGNSYAVPAETAATSDDPQDQWWDNMLMHCGNAYAGSLTLEPPGDDMLEGDELLVVHFRECSEDQIKAPFHIERMDGTWDRSRTWIFTRTESHIELRHDHRRPDGSPDDTTDYGGFTQTPGTPDQQVFIYTDYDDYDPAGPQRGWRVEIEPNVRYTYGTFRGDDWRWRVDFDLTDTVEPPPAPWGHDDGEPS